MKPKPDTKPSSPMIAVGDKIIERPNPKNVPALFQAALESLLPIDELEAMYRGMMSAERVYCDRNGREIRCPDNHIRLATLKDYLDRVVGRPVERQQIIHANSPASLEDLIERSRQSPVFRETLIKLLSRLQELPTAKES